MFRSLFFRISFSVGVVITLTTTVFAYFLIQNQKEHLLQAKKEELILLNAVMRNGFINLMKTGKAQDVHNLMILFRVPEGQWEMRLLDPQGSVLRSTWRNETTTSPRLPQVPSGKAPLLYEEEIQGKPFLSALEPLRNGPSCHSCHGREKDILGFLQVSFPMESTRRSLDFHRNLLIASTALILVLMAAAVNFLLTKLVKNPIGRLTETMSRVEKGDLGAEAVIRSRGELGRLARSFNSMVGKLAQAKRELEKQHQQQMDQVKHLASLGELAASVAHEVKNPLAGIRLGVQLLAKDAGLQAGHRETISDIMSSLLRLDKTVTDLLSYSRIRPPDRRLLNVHEILEAALASVREDGEGQGVRIGRSWDRNLPPLMLDGGQVERAFLNLLVNALQAMPRGGLLSLQTKIRAPADPLPEGCFLPGLLQPGRSWAEVRVADTGEGIPGEVLEEIFRPFFTTKAKGTGLGLSLARRIIEQHQGHIFVRSRPGAGTVFYVLLLLPDEQGQN